MLKFSKVSGSSSKVCLSVPVLSFSTSEFFCFSVVFLCDASKFLDARSSNLSVSSREALLFQFVSCRFLFVISLQFVLIVTFLRICVVSSLCITTLPVSVLLSLLPSLSQGSPNPSLNCLGHFHPGGGDIGSNNLNIGLPCAPAILKNIHTHVSHYADTTITLCTCYYINNSTQNHFLSRLGTTPSGLCGLETSASPWFLNP